jgi:hypothetical protein
MQRLVASGDGQDFLSIVIKLNPPDVKPGGSTAKMIEGISRGYKAVARQMVESLNGAITNVRPARQKDYSVLAASVRIGAIRRLAAQPEVHFMMLSRDFQPE